jgi:nucleotide-binding universal stress UspA family protein
MKRFKNILFAFDNTVERGPAFLRAAHIARLNEARLTLALTLEDAPIDLGGHPDALLADTWWTLRQSVGEQLDELLVSLRQAGIDSGSLILGGTPFIELARAVQQLEIDLLIKSSLPVSGTRDLLFGSTDMHLMRKCPCPVWIQKDRHEGRYRRILAAIDVERTDPKSEGLNRMILDLATSLAAREEAALHVVHAWTVPGEASLRGRAFMRMAHDEVDQLVAREQAKRGQAFDALLSPYRATFEFATDLVKGDPRARIPEIAVETQADLIVMGTVGRTGLPGLIMGNTAEDILRQVDCSVLTIKPEGFVSPVTPEED